MCTRASKGNASKISLCTNMKLLVDCVLVFLITAMYDFIWQQMVKNNIYVCFDRNILLCPNEWAWVKTGASYFQEHSALAAMAIAGISGIYALLLMVYLSSTFSLTPGINAKQILNCLFCSWLVGCIMRSSPDPLNSWLFASARKHYYKPLGFAWSSWTDAQSGLIVAATFKILQCMT